MKKILVGLTVIAMLGIFQACNKIDNAVPAAKASAASQPKNLAVPESFADELVRFNSMPDANGINCYGPPDNCTILEPIVITAPTKLFTSAYLSASQVSVIFNDLSTYGDIIAQLSPQRLQALQSGTISLRKVKQSSVSTVFELESGQQSEGYMEIPTI